jgi:hypothetical protein
MHTDRTNCSSATPIGWYSGPDASDSILRWPNNNQSFTDHKFLCPEPAALTSTAIHVENHSDLDAWNSQALLTTDTKYCMAADEMLSNKMST